MRQVYCKEIRRTEAATPTNYTYDSCVPAGKVLVIKSMAVTYPNFKTSEVGQFFVENGGVIIFVGEDSPDRTHGHAYVIGDFAAGEGDRVGVYNPESASGDKIIFTIQGELWDRDHWRKG